MQHQLYLFSTVIVHDFTNPKNVFPSVCQKRNKFPFCSNESGINKMRKRSELFGFSCIFPIGCLDLVCVKCNTKFANMR